MVTNNKILGAVKKMAGTFLLIGCFLLIYGAFNDSSNILDAIGIGTVMGAVFIFLIGIFFVATEEALEKMKNTVE